MDFKVWALMYQIFTEGMWHNDAIEMLTEAQCEVVKIGFEQKIEVRGDFGYVWCERVKSMDPEDLTFYDLR